MSHHPKNLFTYTCVCVYVCAGGRGGGRVKDPLSTKTLLLVTLYMQCASCADAVQSLYTCHESDRHSRAGSLPERTCTPGRAALQPAAARGRTVPLWRTRRTPPAAQRHPRLGTRHRHRTPQRQSHQDRPPGPGKAHPREWWSRRRSPPRLNI